MSWVLLVHALAAVLVAAGGRRLGRRAFWVASVAPAAALVWLAANASPVLDGAARTQQVDWVPALDLRLTLRVDAFSLVMVGLVAGIGLLVNAYSARYFTHRDDLGRIAALLTLFAASMHGIVVADNLMLLYVFWELTTVTSYLLIGINDEEAAARNAALRAIIVTASGGLAMLAGFVLLAAQAGTASLSEIVADPPSGTLTGVAVFLVLVGAFTKSAQWPFHGWLPAAMAAPTPISAYLHSATMVKAGVYLVARLAPAFAAAYGWWRPLVIGVGLVTMLVGGARALREYDLKLLLAYGTVSQLGFLMVLFGAGYPELTYAGVAMLVAHALFKATLFLVVGIVDHQAHTRDLRLLSGLRHVMPATAVVAVVAAASMAGAPPLFGFVAKEAALEALIHEGATLRLALAGVVLGSVLTVAYSARFLDGAFGGRTVEPAEVEISPPRRSFLAPAAFLAGLSLLVGLVPAPVSTPVLDGARALDPAVLEHALELWHGVNLALVLSALTFAAGGLLFAIRVPLAQSLQRAWAPLVRHDGFAMSIRFMNASAANVTAVVQNGSLPTYLAVILGVAVAAPAVALVANADATVDLAWRHDVLASAAAIAIVVAAVATVRTRRRLAAVLCLGGVGFAVAVIFVIYRAPDLAFTQLVVETLTVVLFVLVLRHLPEQFRHARWRVAGLLRLAVASAVGVAITIFALVASSARVSPPVSGEYVERALPEAGGRNVVNTILVDFRAFDTLGEITVLVVAALGIAGLVLAGRGEKVAR